MAIPDFQSIMLPLMRFFEDRKEHNNSDTVNALVKYFKLTEDELNTLLPSGRQSLFANRVAWAKTHLKMAGLIENTERGVYRITNQGLETLKENPQQINLRYLFKFPKYVEFRKSHREINPPQNNVGIESDATPEEALESAYEKIRLSLANEILEKVKACTPAFFERLVVEVIVKMGYGGTKQDAGNAVGRSGDGGIDGIIKEDKLGLDTIYIQAKRWEAPVGRPEIQKFVGALTGVRAKKGLFISTSNFSKEATDYVTRIDAKVVLIDGEMLAQLMIDHSVGVSTVTSYDLKKIDSDYFLEE